MATDQDAHTSIDEERLDELLGTVVDELGATVHAGLVVIGQRLGLYEALDTAGPLTASDLADLTDTTERYVREWLAAGAASGYVTYDPETERYSLSPEQAAVLADEDSPAFMGGGFQAAVATVMSTPDIEADFPTGEGIGWHEHDDGLFHGTEMFWKPTYADNVVSEWIPALEGVAPTLQEGGHVADVGCGHGASTILMAQAYPESTFIGYDYHEGSIEVARERAAEAGIDDRVSFEVARAKEYDGAEYDFVTTFDCYHDMGDPAGTAAHIRETLTEDGTWMIVEPYAADRVEENLNPVGRAYYSWSTMLCVPNALDQGTGPALGAQAGAQRLREVASAGGFSEIRLAVETPFNLVLEAKA